MNQWDDERIAEAAKLVATAETPATIEFTARVALTEMRNEYESIIENMQETIDNLVGI